VLDENGGSHPPENQVNEERDSFREKKRKITAKNKKGTLKGKRVGETELAGAGIHLNTKGPIKTQRRTS